MHVVRPIARHVITQMLHVVKNVEVVGWIRASRGTKRMPLDSIIQGLNVVDDAVDDVAGNIYWSLACGARRHALTPLSSGT
jgi:hypothetical protein